MEGSEPVANCPVSSHVGKDAGGCSGRESVVSRDISVEHFWNSFNDLAEQMQGQLLPASATAGLDGLHLEAASELLRQLQLMIGNWSQQLPAFELMRAQQRANTLQQILYAHQQVAAPRKKFGFKNRHAVTSVDAANTHIDFSSVAQSDHVAAADSADAGHSTIDAGATTISARHGEQVTLAAAELTGRHLSLTSLTECSVTVLGLGSGAATVHLAHLRHCRLLLASVSQSVMLDDCWHCSLAVTCQQLRIHASQQCRLFVSVTCGPVLENCSDIVVAPFPLCLIPAEERRDAYNRPNQWNDVQDFNWLSRSQPSPHWRTVSLSDTSAEHIWADMIGLV